MSSIRTTLFSRCTAAIVAVFLFASVPYLADAEIVGTGAPPLSQVDVFLSPQNASYREGSTFDIPIFVNTRDQSINAINLSLSFDQSKIRIINPSGGRSIVGVWVSAPLYDNSRGTLQLSGLIPNGIKTESGLVATLTFKALQPGQAFVRFTPESRILLNDGLGTEATTEFMRGSYDIVPKPPEGVTVYSDTHASQATWYNNPNPVIRWDNVPGVEGYSYVLDTKPNTIPDNDIKTKDTFISYSDLSDGVWYFHLKALKRGVWGGTTHFALRIDSTEPEPFEPRFESSVSSRGWVRLVSFDAVDRGSGIEHYEVGVVDASKAETALPVFIESESPYTLPQESGTLAVTVRAFDKAGNTRDVTVTVMPRVFVMAAIQNYAVSILLLILLLALALFAYHYVFGHRFFARFRRAVRVFEEEPVQPEATEPQPVTKAEVGEVHPAPPSQNREPPLMTG